MTKQLGRMMLVRIGNGATPTEAFGLLCGLRSKTLTINNSEIDVTTADCTTPGGSLWTEVLSGVKRVSLTGNGYFKDEATEATMNTKVMSADPTANFEIVVPELGTFSGKFFISNVDYGGEQEDGVTYSLSLASTGVVAFAPAA